MATRRTRQPDRRAGRSKLEARDVCQSHSRRLAAVSAAHRAVSRRPAAAQDFRSALSRHGARVPARKNAVRRVSAEKRSRDCVAGRSVGAGERRLSGRDHANAMSIRSACCSCRRAARSASGCFRIAWSRAICSSAWRKPSARTSRCRASKRSRSSARARKCWSASSIRSRRATRRTFRSPSRFSSTIRRGCPTVSSEILPIPMRARQKLMELDDAAARIDVVHHYMQHHQLL